MTAEEKLARCVEFIRGIERGEIEDGVRVNAEDPRVRGYFQCDECGSRNIIGSTYVGIPDGLRDKAWHLLADIDGL